MATKKQTTFQLGTKRLGLLSRFCMSLAKKRLDQTKKAAVFLQKHPTIATWLMKKDPKLAIAIPAIIAIFANSDSKKTSKKSIDYQPIIKELMSKSARAAA